MFFSHWTFEKVKEMAIGVGVTVKSRQDNIMCTIQIPNWTNILVESFNNIYKPKCVCVYSLLGLSWVSLLTTKGIPICSKWYMMACVLPVDGGLNIYDDVISRCPHVSPLFLLSPPPLTLSLHSLLPFPFWKGGGRFVPLNSYCTLLFLSPIIYFSPWGENIPQKI